MRPRFAEFLRHHASFEHATAFARTAHQQRNTTMDLGLEGKKRRRARRHARHRTGDCGTLAGEGAGVAVCARNADQVASTVAELKARASRPPAHRRHHRRRGAEIMDRGRREGTRQHRHAVLQCRRHGARRRSRLVEQNFRLDVLGAVNAFEAARPFLEASGEKSGDAAVVIISSVSAAQADTASSYGPIKAALIHMAKGLARQYARRKSASTWCRPARSISRAASGT